MTVADALAVRHRLAAWVAPVTVGGAALVACLALAVVDPTTRARYTPTCPFRLATGLDCPSCGATRAMHALAQGQVGLALEHHALLVVSLPLVAAGWVAWLRAGLGRRPPLQASRRAGLAIAGALTAFWVLRNLPWAPLAWLGSGVG